MSLDKAAAIVGIGAVLPDAPDALTFWDNIKKGRYSITDVPRERWNPDLYYDEDPGVPDKTYSRIGGWVRQWVWEPLKWRLPIPPKVSQAMDLSQIWAIVASRQALNDYGYPSRHLDPMRTAVILGNAMGGDTHLYSAARILFPEFAEELAKAASFSSLPRERQEQILSQMREGVGLRMPPITEDTMPGELGNIVAGRVAAVFDFHGPNYVADAACASAMAAISAAVEGLQKRDFDSVLTGGIDGNMSPSTFVKFCKIGALSATGTRPYAKGADGFVMGEGGVVFLLKRLSDAERDGDKVYAVILGQGGSSDGKGKGITAPNPLGQKLSIQRAWDDAGVRPSAGDLIEGHGTSTQVGDVAEVQSLHESFSGFDLPRSSIALGSVKSNIGHLKGAAGAVGLLKATLALHEKVLPPSLNYEEPNPDIDFASSPFAVNTELRPWQKNGGVRRAGVSAFGFGGTNFHTVLEEYIPGRQETDRRASVSVSEPQRRHGNDVPLPLRGALVIGADSRESLAAPLRSIRDAAARGDAPAPEAPTESVLSAKVRLTIDYGSAKELEEKATRALDALGRDQSGRWKVLRQKGVFVHEGRAPKVAFLFSGQGSQYANMMRSLRDKEPVVSRTFEEADRIMTPLLGRPLSQYIFVPEDDKEALAAAEESLKQTAITQPAVLATETALSRILVRHGIEPDLVMGHSLGEYGALVAADAISFEDALVAVSARGEEMTRCSMDDNGLMAAAFGPLDEIERIVESIDGYVVVANINSTRQSVIGGGTEATLKAMAAIREAGYVIQQIPVSHAFHTQIVAPASEGLTKVLGRLHVRSPRVPVVANVTGEFYPAGPEVASEMIELLGRQIASPVQFVKGLRTLYDCGARIFVEVGPKRVLSGFVENVLGEHDDVVSLFTNHPRVGEAASVNIALCGLFAAGLGLGRRDAPLPPAIDIHQKPTAEPSSKPFSTERETGDVSGPHTAPKRSATPANPVEADSDRYQQLGRLFAEFLDRGSEIYHGRSSIPSPGKSRVGITGASLALPGVDQVFDDSNVERLLRGDQFIDSIPIQLRQAMLDKNITRLVKSESGGRFESIEALDDVIKLAARAGQFDLKEDFGFPEERLVALDRVTQLAIGAGIDALRDAGVPLVMRYKTTTKGTQLPDRWSLPEEMRDDTGVVFASAFPGYDSLIQILAEFYDDRARRMRLEDLRGVRNEVGSSDGASTSTLAELDRRIARLEDGIDGKPFHFDRRFLFRVLSMGHSQFAEHIGARGPNTAINAACASGTQAISLATDWIQSGRCRRVIVLSADDITSDHLMGWFGSGFLASGAAAVDENVEDAAIPFDKRRHGLIVGMGSAALVVESLDSAQDRGIVPICEVLETTTANSAFHGTRLDVSHICVVMEDLIRKAETEWNINRHQIAPQTVFVSHETYTPARGGSASAEINALREVFGSSASQIVIANTKGATGHPMGVGIEDAAAVKILETGIVPPVPNFKEVDPELGRINLSKGGSYPVQYSLRLAAGFGSQISMTLLRWIPPANGQHRAPHELGHAYRIANPEAWNRWLCRITGYAAPEVEIERRTLRVKNQGPLQPSQAASLPQQQSVPASPSPPLETTEPPQVSVRDEPERSPTYSAQAVEEEAAIPPVQTEGDPVRERVLGIIAEKSGYPPDMLDLDLDLEADLGIDTVKQAEMFAAIREEYDIPRDDALKLRDYPTLEHAIQFVYDRKPELKGVTAAPTDQSEVEAATVDADDPVRARVLGIIAEKSGYPPDMLDLDLDLEADLGIDTVKQAEMFAAIREEYDIPRDDALKLRDYPTLEHAIQFVYDRKPELKGATAAPTDQSEVEAATVDAGDPVRERVLGIIAEKSGYPPDMLDLDLDLEADLGIDTVKQAEMFAAIREEYDIPRDDALKLRDYPTLEHAIQFVYDRKPELTAESPAAQSGTKDIPDRVDSSEAGPRTVRIPRRVPVPNLRPALELCVPTGVELGEGCRVVVMPDKAGVASALCRVLEKAGVRPLIIKGTPDSDELTRRIGQWKEEGPIQGVFWLAALDREPELEDMTLEDWREAIRIRTKLLFQSMRVLSDQIGTRGTFLVAATRLGGLHGYDEEGAVATLGGGVTGFTKAYKREKPEALVKVVDFAESRKTRALAEKLLAETLADPGAVEIGYRHGLRWAIGFREEQRTEAGSLQLGEDSVFLVTGAAGSIVSAIVSDLAAASGGTFYLLDLAPAPDPANLDLQRVADDREGLKADLVGRLRQSGKKVTPGMVEKELALLERAHSALSAIHSIEKAGGSAHYRSLNLLDHSAVAAVVEEIRRDHGRVDVFLHGAGIEISRLLEDKQPSEFDLVFDVKVDGWFNVISTLRDLPLGAAVVFSSIAGRFGNRGQTDYSAANDLLCKAISGFRARRPKVRAVALDWTAWAGIGMAARGSIPTIMKQAGIDMLPPEVGVPFVRAELTQGQGSEEVIVAGDLGVMVDEFAVGGGLRPDAFPQSVRDAGVMAGRVTGMGLYTGLTLETELNPTEQPFLSDHQIDGTPVLPGVMGIEALVETSLRLLPNWHAVRVEDVVFRSPFKFYRSQPRTLRLSAVLELAGKDIMAFCRLEGSRSLHGREEPEVTTHFVGKVHLSRRPTELPGRGKKIEDPRREASVGAGDIYRVYFHGPAYQVIEEAWSFGSEGTVVGRMATDLPSNHHPVERATQTTPRAVELCFQTAGLWELATHLTMGLPYRIDKLFLFDHAASSESDLFSVVTPREDGSYDAEVLDPEGGVRLRLEGYRTIEVPQPPKESLLGPLRRALGSTRPGAGPQ